MVRERIKELVDFATTESPYRDANKGWVTDDVYLEWGSSQEKNSLEGKELANISVYWKPINQIASILFVVVSCAAIFVFTSVSFAHGRFQIPAGIEIEPTIVIPEAKSIDLKEQTTIQEEAINRVGLVDLDPLVQTKPEFEKTLKQTDFAAAALGGRRPTN